MMAIAVIGAAPAYADNLHGFGCGSTTAAGAATSAPGNSATSPGSTHNEPLASGTPVVSVNGGTGGAAYNSARQGAAAPSNYDTSCGNVTAHGTGTPIQQSTVPVQMLPNRVANNSLLTRTNEGVLSHSTFAQAPK
jgi:hypothetical protein